MSKIIPDTYVPALLLLENGEEFSGYAAGSLGMTVAELIFNTAMTGYQEVLTDPSYKEQIVVFSAPHIGNTGVNRFDVESASVAVKGLVMRELSTYTSSWRAEESLTTYLEKNAVIGIFGVDTRRLVQILRDSGAQVAAIMAGEGYIDRDKAKALIQSVVEMPPKDLVTEVSTCGTHSWDDDSTAWFRGRSTQDFSVLSFQKREASAFQPHIVVYDFGAKWQILRLLKDRGCKVTLVPAQTEFQEVLALSPDGVVLSNGPGNPSECVYATESVKEIIERSIPLLGICLGFQIIALACGAKTQKMLFGHHGANHPVSECIDGETKVYITAQNHGFCVDVHTMPDTYEMTHYSLFDQTVQGFRHREKPVLGFQGHPEGSPGPHSAAFLFDQFLSYIKR
eukprot:TRINITY_DN13309_c0_g1_i2.p2 TRINITY_DN13309_c0_g1~~TRINITY_DN13309_c0_g1_i2.p2  ORF type:complete len:396 (+),score=-95.55 TRINITY_DN13309_c0_g1_i2:842-2029(+)